VNLIFFQKCYFDGLLGPPKEFFDEIIKGSKISWDGPFNKKVTWKVTRRQRQWQKFSCSDKPDRVLKHSLLTDFQKGVFSSNFLNGQGLFWNGQGLFWNGQGLFWNGQGLFLNGQGLFWNGQGLFWNGQGLFWNGQGLFWNVLSYKCGSLVMIVVVWFWNVTFLF